MIRLKICGLRDNIAEVAKLCPDYLGFIFYSKSPRCVRKDFKMPEINRHTKKVGVFVNEKVEEIGRLVRKYRLDFVQLHGFETPEVCGECKGFGVGVIKAFQMEDNFNFQQLVAYKDVVDFFLFDTKTRSYGGSGKTFDWSILSKYSLKKEYFLSGGLSLENIDEINNLDQSKIHAIDVNSKFELSPGLKDLNKLRKLGTYLLSQNIVGDQM